MTSLKNFVLYSAVIYCVLQNSLGQDASVPATEVPLAVKNDNATEEVDDLNGPSNDTCHSFDSCGSCHDAGCKWTSCNNGNPSCVSTLMTECEMVTCDPTPSLNSCDNATTCELCQALNCTFVTCESELYCAIMPVELCSVVQNCSSVAPSTTVAPSDNTTTTTAPDVPTTTLIPDNTTTTTSAPDTTTATTAAPTTSAPTNDSTTTTELPTTKTPDVPTTTPGTTTSTEAPATTTAGPVPVPSGGFSAGSFFGGAFLTLALLAVGFGGYKFYKTRYDVNYRTL